MRCKPSKDILAEMYVDRELTMKEIANMLGFSVGTIHKCIHEYGIPIRPRGYGLRERHLSPETKKKISEKLKGRKRTEEQRKQMSERLKKGGIGHKKTRKDGYISIYFPDHPMSNSEGYIMEHILVMECHIGRWINNDEAVHHINHIRSDNRLENLRLMTQKEHMSMHMKERHANGGVPHKTVKIINLDTGEIFKSIKEAAEKYNTQITHISRVCRGKRKRTSGYRWAYLNEGSEDLSIQ